MVELFSTQNYVCVKLWLKVQAWQITIWGFFSKVLETLEVYHLISKVFRTLLKKPQIAICPAYSKLYIAIVFHKDSQLIKLISIKQKRNHYDVQMENSNFINRKIQALSVKMQLHSSRTATELCSCPCIVIPFH